MPFGIQRYEKTFTRTKQGSLEDSFVYDTQSGTLEEITEWGALSAVLDDGTIFGMDMQFDNGVIRTADFEGMLKDYLVERGLDVSAEGIPALISASTADCSVIPFTVVHSNIYISNLQGKQQYFA